MVQPRGSESDNLCNNESSAKEFCYRRSFFWDLPSFFDSGLPVDFRRDGLSKRYVLLVKHGEHLMQLSFIYGTG